MKTSPINSHTSTSAWLLTLLLCSLLLLALSSASAQIVVNSTGDGGLVYGGKYGCESDLLRGNVCTLRAAIQYANLDPDLTTITFNIPTTDTGYDAENHSYRIGLSSNPLPTLNTDVAITGPGQKSLIIQGTAQSFPIFEIPEAVAVTLSGMDITKGSHGIMITKNATVNVINCAIEDNGGHVEGGGILNGAGTVNITTSSFADNFAHGEDADPGQRGIGGGISNYGQVNISNSVFLYNNSTGGRSSHSSGGDAAGGAIFNAGTANIANTTFYLNSATGNLGIDASSRGAGSGAGIFNQSVLRISNSTITANVTYGNGGAGGGVDSPLATATIKSTIIALNKTSSNAGPDVVGGFASQGFNLIGNTDYSSGFNATTDLTGTPASPLDPKFRLAPNGMPFLGDNGGPTSTMALLPGSPAIDKGTSNSLFGALTTDQRGGGFARRIDKAIPNATGGDGTDIGAYELGTAARSRPDFNDDGFADYLLFNGSTLRTAMWYLHGSAFAGGSYAPFLPTGWVIAGTADFDSNGSPDYVLVRPSTRQTAVWFLNKASLIGGSFGPTLPAGWNLLAAADFDRDGRPDYLLFNPATRQSAVWFLNRTTLVRGAFGPTLPTGWTLIDALPFDLSADNPHYLLFNPTTRQTAVWYLKGTVFEHGQLGPTLPAGWILKGASDVNRDMYNSLDYVLFQPTTRRTAFWFLNGLTMQVTGAAFGPTLPSGYDLAVP